MNKHSLACVFRCVSVLHAAMLRAVCLLFADKYLKDIPKSPVRELLEMEPETAKFE